MAARLDHHRDLHAFSVFGFALPKSVLPYLCGLLEQHIVTRRAFRLYHTLRRPGWETLPRRAHVQTAALSTCQRLLIYLNGLDY
jgi:hypothetical protein